MRRLLPDLRACMLAVGVLAVSAPAWAQPNTCADCHLSRPDLAGTRHVADWESGPHGRNGVGCASCHGGNATSFEPFLAHQGILHRSHPASPVGRIALPATCGSCHGGPFTSFQKSKHYELVRSGDRDAPTCATCHGETAAILLSPRQLEARCASCHGAGRVAPNVDFPAEGRLMLEGIRDARAELKEAAAVIRRINDASRRTALEAEAARAGVPLAEATSAGHAFVFDRLQERLAIARERITALYEHLANPGETRDGPR